MNKATLNQLEKKIDRYLKGKKESFNFPLLGGLSGGPKAHREITQEEGIILRSKKLPIPICIALDREKEFLEIINGERVVV